MEQYDSGRCKKKLPQMWHDTLEKEVRNRVWPEELDDVLAEIPGTIARRLLEEDILGRKRARQCLYSLLASCDLIEMAIRMAMMMAVFCNCLIR